MPPVGTPSQGDLLTGFREEGGQGAPTTHQLNSVRWYGQIPPQKWMNFYTKVLTKLGVNSGLTLNVKVEFKPEGGLSRQKIDEVRSALRDLGLDDKID
jgi:hypothetical protein